MCQVTEKIVATLFCLWDAWMFLMMYLQSRD